MCTGLISS